MRESELIHTSARGKSAENTAGKPTTLRTIHYYDNNKNNAIKAVKKQAKNKHKQEGTDNPSWLMATMKEGSR